MTSFKQVKDNAVSTTATSYGSTGVTSTTVATGDGAKFPVPGNGFFATIWVGPTGSDPGSDANMEIVTVTARSGDVMTHSATTKTHTGGTVNFALLDVAQNITDIQTAVTGIENGTTTLNGVKSSNNIWVQGGTPLELSNANDNAFILITNSGTTGQNKLVIKPDIDATNAVIFRTSNAGGPTDVMTVDTTNKKVTVAGDPTAALGVATKQYVDNQATSSSFVVNEVPSGSVNGSNTAFTTASNMATGSLRVFRNGVRLKGGGVDFTQGANNAFTMVTAPNTGDTMLVDYNVSATGFTVGTNSTMSSEVPTGTVNGTTTAFTTSRAYIAGSLEVYLDGVHQRRTTDYTETTPGSGIFTMATAPLTGQSVVCNYQFNLNPSSNADTVDGIHASSTATANQLFPLDGNAKFGTDIQYDASDRIADHVVSGGVVALSSGLIGTFSDIVYYIGGKRYTATGIANHTYTASNDCYVDIDTTGTVTYTTGANNFASPVLAANSIRIAVVVTNGSTISYVHQGKFDFGATATGGSSAKIAFSDGKGYAVYPTQAVQKIIAGQVRNTAPTTGQPGATSVAYNGINYLPFQSTANTNYKVKFYEPVVSGITATGSWTVELYLSASAGAYTTRIDEFTMIMIGTANNGLTFELPFNSGTYSGLTYLEFKLRSSTTTGTATMNGDTTTRMGRFWIEKA